MARFEGGGDRSLDANRPFIPGYNKWTFLRDQFVRPGDHQELSGLSPSSVEFGDYNEADYLQFERSRF